MTASVGCPHLKDNISVLGETTEGYEILHRNRAPQTCLQHGKYGIASDAVSV